MDRSRLAVEPAEVLAKRVAAAEVFVHGHGRLDLEHLVPERIEVVDAEPAAEGPMYAPPQLGVGISVVNRSSPATSAHGRSMNRTVAPSFRPTCSALPLRGEDAERVIRPPSRSVGEPDIAVDRDRQVMAEVELVEPSL